ncbi:MAG: hypothetical protein ACYDAL_18695 [Candidatus Dormibacteraceae bacterium]
MSPLTAVATAVAMLLPALALPRAPQAPRPHSLGRLHPQGAAAPGPPNRAEAHTGPDPAAPALTSIHQSAGWTESALDGEVTPSR